MTTATRRLLAGGCALLGFVAAPAAALAADPPTPTPTCSAPPCVVPAAAQLTLTQTVDRTTAAVGDKVNYTVTLGNTGTLPAALVTVDEVLDGTAGYIVDDGANGTANSWFGQPLTTVTRVVGGHYRWGYPVVNPGDSDVVRFSAVLTAPAGSAPSVPTSIVLTSTATSDGVAPATVTTTASLTPPTTAAPGGLRGARTSVPATGSGVDVSAAGFLLLGGLGVALLGMHARRRSRAGVTRVGPPPGLSR